MARGTGVPCGASHISAAYICRVDSVGPRSEAAISKLQKSLDGMSPGAAEQWGGIINLSLNGSLRTVHSNGKPYTTEEFDKQMVGRANAWGKLIKDGPPKELLMRDGTVVSAPEGMTPNVSNTGQRFWIHPDNGLKYSAPAFASKTEGGEMKPARQNRVSKMDSARRAEDMVSFRRTALEQKAAWPTQELPVSGKPLDAAKIKASLTDAEKRSVSMNGLDWTHNEGKLLNEYYANNPKAAEKRLDDVISRYAAQDGRSGVSGRPIALPGLDPKPGQEKSSVDHFRPISTGKGQTATQLIKSVDNGQNFLLTEEGFNSQRGNRSWSGYANKWEKELTKDGGITTRSGPGAWGAGVASAGARTPSAAPAKPTKASKPAKASSKPAPPKVKTAAQKTAERDFIRQKLNQAKADKRSGDIKIWEDALKKL